MDIDPAEIVKTDDTTATKKDAAKQRLNNYVAVTVALLATFIGICKIKDDNIVQAMQQAQADKIDHYSWYQARNVREEIAKATVAQLQLQASQPAANRPAYQKQIAIYQQLAKEQNQKKQELKVAAENDQKNYDERNFHDDQFDLSDSSLSIAISLLAITALLQKRWMFGVAMIPTAFGVLMGLAGLLGWSVHPDALTKLLSVNPSSPVEWKLTRR